jgi:hypothetical protein
VAITTPHRIRLVTLARSPTASHNAIPDIVNRRAVLALIVVSPLPALFNTGRSATQPTITITPRQIAATAATRAARYLVPKAADEKCNIGTFAIWVLALPSPGLAEHWGGTDSPTNAAFESC